MIYADWQVDAPVDESLLRLVDENWDRDDESFCSSPGDADPEALSLSFDVRAGSCEEAIEHAMPRLAEFGARLGLAGRLLRVRAYDETGWSERRL